MSTAHRGCLAASLGLFLWSHPSAAAPFTDVGNLPAPVAAKQLIYSPCFESLVLKNSASTIAVVNTKTGNSALRSSVTQFSDMSLSPDQTTVFAADYGGENIGYSTPASQSYVHRLDLATGTWKAKTAYIAGNVQAMSPTAFVLKSIDQWVSFELYDWGPSDTAATSLKRYYASVYFGDFRYDYRTQRLIHGNSNSSSQEITAFKIVGNTFVGQEGSGIYGTAQGYGGTVALSTDGSAFYYGTLSVQALDVSANLHVFPKAIYAATGDVAFGEDTYYDSHTGAVLGALDFKTTAYGINPNGSDFWAYDAGTNTVHHFVRTGGTGGVCTPFPTSPEPDAGASGVDAGADAGREGGATKDAGDGADTSTPRDGGPRDGAVVVVEAGSPSGGTAAGGRSSGGSSSRGGANPGSGGRLAGNGGASGRPASAGGATADASTDGVRGDTRDSGGCGCELAPRPAHPALSAGTFALALLGLRRRPRTRDRRRA